MWVIQFHLGVKNNINFSLTFILNKEIPARLIGDNSKLVYKSHTKINTQISALFSIVIIKKYQCKPYYSIK